MDRCSASMVLFFGTAQVDCCIVHCHCICQRNGQRSPEVAKCLYRSYPPRAQRMKMKINGMDLAGKRLRDYRLMLGRSYCDEGYTSEDYGKYGNEDVEHQRLQASN